jgi:hypothetical protein
LQALRLQLALLYYRTWITRVVPFNESTISPSTSASIPVFVLVNLIGTHIESAIYNLIITRRYKLIVSDDNDHIITTRSAFGHVICVIRRNLCACRDKYQNRESLISRYSRAYRSIGRITRIITSEVGRRPDVNHREGGRSAEAGRAFRRNGNPPYEIRLLF